MVVIKSSIATWNNNAVATRKVCRMNKTLTDREIENLYDQGENRLTQERLDFLLPQVIDFVRDKKWLNLQPEYQRRLVWDRRKKSLLIESLLMNVPIPPVFLYEYDLNRYEVMDGQQRLNTIMDFYDNRFSLVGLSNWSSINGRQYGDLPPRIKNGLDRRRISATVLLPESNKARINGEDVRRTVFERLNTGGQNLNAQELRNCLYSGPFNDLLVDLAGNRLFDEIWGIPPYDDNIRGGQINQKLRENGLYRRMRDCEIVLRFFAFRKRSKLKGAVKTILDNCMKENRAMDRSTIDGLKQIFISRIQLSYDIFESQAFKIERNKWQLSEPLYDAIMVSLDNLYPHHASLVQNKKRISTDLQGLLADEAAYEIIVGRPNTSKAIRGRLDLVQDFLHAYT